jgi:hypothetical protein
MSNGIIWKNENYYDEVIPRQDFGTFKANFRLSRQTFVLVLNLMGNSNHFAKRNEAYGGRNQISSEKSLLITLWTLATPESYRAIGDRFNVSKSTVYNSLEVIITVILLELGPRFIRWPDENEKIEIANNFSRYGLPNIIGAIDGSHIPIKKPTENGIDYFNRKKYYSMVLQAVCRHDLIFLDCDIRWPGSVHDGRVLRTSDMYPIGQELCGPDHHIIGDSAYPIKNWLITPYKNNGHLQPFQVLFNKILSKTRVKIENAFALLKGRFRRLKDLLDRNDDNAIARTVITCCVLHNICIMNGEDEIQQYIREGHNENREIPMIPGIGYNENDNAGVIKRNLLAQELWNNQYVEFR